MLLVEGRKRQDVKAREMYISSGKLITLLELKAKVFTVISISKKLAHEIFVAAMKYYYLKKIIWVVCLITLKPFVV